MRKLRPRWLRGFFVLVEQTGKAVASADVEVGKLVLVDWFW